MSTKLPKITSSDLTSVIKQSGFVLDRQSGSHAIFFHPGKRLRVVIPVHKKIIIKPKTLLSILDDAGITVEHLKELL